MPKIAHVDLSRHKVQPCNRYPMAKQWSGWSVQSDAPDHGLGDMLRGLTVQTPTGECYYIEYKKVAKKIKRVAAEKEAAAANSALAEPASEHASIDEVLAEEICRVNTCFQGMRRELLESIACLQACLSDPAAQNVDMAFTEQITKGSSVAQSCAGITNDDGSASGAKRLRPCSETNKDLWGVCKSLVEVRDKLIRLEEYAVCNACAVAQIFRKLCKHDQSMDSRWDHWLKQLGFIEGSDLAELHLAVEALGRSPALLQIEAIFAKDAAANPMAISPCFEATVFEHAVK